MLERNKKKMMAHPQHPLDIEWQNKIVSSTILKDISHTSHRKKKSTNQLDASFKKHKREKPFINMLKPFEMLNLHTPLRMSGKAERLKAL